MQFFSAKPVLRARYFPGLFLACYLGYFEVCNIYLNCSGESLVPEPERGSGRSLQADQDQVRGLQRLQEMIRAEIVSLSKFIDLVILSDIKMLLTNNLPRRIHSNKIVDIINVLGHI